MSCKLDKPTIICHIEKDLNYTLYDCKWIPETAKFVLVGAHPRGHGILQVFEVGTNELKSVNQIECPVSMKCGTFGAASRGEKHFATGDFKGNVQIWDLNYSKTVFDIKGHEEIINTIDGLGGPPEIATGSRDGAVKLWDVRQKDKAVATFQSSDGDVKRDCWAVTLGNSFGNDERMLCAGYDNGDVKLFDLKQMKLIWEKNVKNGVCSLQFDRKNIEMNKLLVTTLESKFHVFDCRTLHPTKGFASVAEKAHKSTVWIGQHLPQNRDLFMTTGGNGSLSLWKYCYPEKRVKKDSENVDIGIPGTLELLQNMTLSTQPLSSFDWCEGKLGLGICTSFDQCVRLIIVTKLNLY